MALCIIVTGKDVQPAIIVDICKIHGLQKQPRPGKIRRRPSRAARIRPEEFQSIIVTADHKVAHSVIIRIGNRQSPLLPSKSESHRIMAEESISFLKLDQHFLRTTETDNIIHSITIHVGDTHRNTTMDITIGQ